MSSPRPCGGWRPKEHRKATGDADYAENFVTTKSLTPPVHVPVSALPSQKEGGIPSNHRNILPQL